MKTINDYILVTIISLNIVIFFYLIVVNYKKYNLIILRVYKYLIFFIILITIIYFVFILNFYIKYFGVSFEQLIKQDLYNFIKVILVSVNNINPFNKFPFYLSNNNFLHLSFGTISCLVLILFIIQVLIGNLINHLNFSKSKNILVGLIMIFIIYGFSKTYIDVRIIISALLPFFLFIDFRFFNLKGYFLVTIGTLFASLLNFFIF